MTTTYFPGRPLVVEDLTDERTHRKNLARAVNLALRGQSGNTLQVTLDPSVSSTTIVDSRISISTACHMIPMTSDAASELASGNLWVVPAAGQAVINHTNSGVADRIFMVSLIG